MRPDATRARVYCVCVRERDRQRERECVRERKGERVHIWPFFGGGGTDFEFSINI
jgi:hypothetical protein